MRVNQDSLKLVATCRSRAGRAPETALVIAAVLLLVWWFGWEGVGSSHISRGANWSSWPGTRWMTANMRKLSSLPRLLSSDTTMLADAHAHPVFRSPSSCVQYRVILLPRPATSPTYHAGLINSRDQSLPSWHLVGHADSNQTHRHACRARGLQVCQSHQWQGSERERRRSHRPDWLAHGSDAETGRVVLMRRALT